MTVSTRFGPGADIPGPLIRLLDRWRGRRVAYGAAEYESRLRAITERGVELRAQSDFALKELAARLHDKARAGEDVLTAVFALACEAAHRRVGMRPFDVQVVGGLAIHEGQLVEMQTGEGKTLVAVLPACLDAMSGLSVHVVTFNDYLARRDARWMGPIYRFLGLDVRHVEAGMSPAERRRAYQADVVYLTAKEAGFDYLRDGLCYRPEDRVHRGFESVIVDEADSILIDEARIPLVIAGDREGDVHHASRMEALSAELTRGVHYEIGEGGRNVYLTDAGITAVEGALGIDSLTDPDRAHLYGAINQALHAKELLSRDVDYIVRDGAIELVDELTGRVVSDRQWPDGLQAALEAKEGLRFGKEGTIFGSITLQHFFGLYSKVAGMTATARPDDEELSEHYDLSVLVLPPNRPCVREDHPDRIHVDKKGKAQAIVDEISAAHSKGRPVLVGTASVRESEELSATLSALGLAHKVLNAKTDEQEARVIAEAGAPGQITLSTNMAGRGTDIRLGGHAEQDRAQVVGLGGLLVIGTNRHESRRIDRQLRGRAGRQGDPGASVLIASLEDEVAKRYGVADALPAALRAPRAGPLDSPVVRRHVARAQRVIEGQNADIRASLLKYSNLAEQQRQIVRAQRDAVLDGSRAAERWASASDEYRARLVEAVGGERAAHVEQQVTLFCLDRAWADHLAVLSELREGIHLVRLGSEDPLRQFIREADRAFRRFVERVERDLLEVLDGLVSSDGEVDLARLGIRGPSCTWTYMVDDDPFRNMLTLHVAQSIPLALGAALHYPIYMAIAAWRRWVARRPKQ